MFLSYSNFLQNPFLPGKENGNNLDTHFPFLSRRETSWSTKVADDIDLVVAVCKFTRVKDFLLSLGLLAQLQFVDAGGDRKDVKIFKLQINNSLF